MHQGVEMHLDHVLELFSLNVRTPLPFSPFQSEVFGPSHYQISAYTRTSALENTPAQEIAKQATKVSANKPSASQLILSCGIATKLARWLAT